MIASLVRAFGYYFYKPAGLPFGIDVVLDIRKLGRPDPEIVFDVGANIGATARSYAAAWPNAVVHAFEPIPSNFRYLAEVAKQNPQITAIQRACGRKSGTVAVLPRESETHTLSDATTLEEASADRIKVQVTTLDEYCQGSDIRRIHFLKTDTEGFDLEVLHGAEGLLRQGLVGLILSEIEFRERPSGPHTNFFALHAYLAPFGFQVATIYTEAMDSEGFFYGSALFVCSPGKG